MVQQQTGRNQWDGELGAKEREDFLTLPEWHRKMFLNFPCPLDTTNIERIRKSLSAVNNGNDEANILWSRAILARRNASEEMSILMLACMVFPMLEYSKSRITFEHNLLESLGVELVIWQEEHPYFVFAFSDEEYEQIIRKPVNVHDVNKFAETRPQGYEIILGLTVWQNYIKERKEESEKYRKYLLGEIFGDDQQLSPELLPPPKPQRIRKATPLLNACLTVWRKQSGCQDAQPATAIELLNVATVQQGVVGHPNLRVSGDKIEWTEKGSLEMKHFRAAFKSHFGR